MKTQALSRHSFLRGSYQPDAVIRPPWAVEESLFTDACTRCFACAKACPSHLIVKGQGGYPEVSFSRHGCDYCEACVRACEDSALILNEENQHQPWYQHAIINKDCFSRRGVICRSCGDVCETRAIRFKPALAGRSKISLDESACNGCGECVHVCPAHAIEIKRYPVGEIHE